jgi:hypothetical protein
MKQGNGLMSFKYLRTIIYLSAGKINIPLPTRFYNSLQYDWNCSGT